MPNAGSEGKVPIHEIKGKQQKMHLEIHPQIFSNLLSTILSLDNLCHSRSTRWSIYRGSTGGKIQDFVSPMSMSDEFSRGLDHSKG